MFYYITDDDEIQYKEFQFQSFQTHAHIHRQGLYANLSIGEKLYYGRRRLTLHNIRIWDLHDENKEREGYLNELWQRLDIMYLHPRTHFIGFRRCVKTWATGAHGWHDVTIMSVSFRYVLRDSSPPASESCITKTIPTEEYQLGLEERTVEYKGEKKMAVSYFRSPIRHAHVDCKMTAGWRTKQCRARCTSRYRRIVFSLLPTRVSFFCCSPFIVD